MEKEDLIEKFFKSKKNANCILDLEKSLLSEDISTILDSMDLCQELFNQIFQKHMLEESQSNDESEVLFRKWLLSTYNDFVSHLTTYLCHQEEEVKEKALQTLMSFITLEAKYPFITINPKNCYFPEQLFQKMIIEILSDVNDQHDLILKFKNYSAFEDIKFYTLKAIEKVFEERQEVSDVFLRNCFFLLNSCTPNKSSSTFLAEIGVTKTFSLKKNLFSRTFSNVWSTFLKYELPVPLLRKVLVVLPKRVMQHFQNPYLLTDFLTDLYNKGGLISLLALSGLFELMQKYNFEYPDFYIKFYSLFEAEIVNGKFHSTFFYLADLFLSSTHLPAHMVAAFVKKLSRVSLRSNTESLVKLLPLIRNLLVRHSTLHILLHRDSPKELNEDPFDSTATDPSESQAMESSLWEIKELKNHFNPAVTQKVKITNEIPKLEFDLADVLDISTDSLYEKDRKRKFSEVTLNEKPSKLKNILDFS